MRLPARLALAAAVGVAVGATGQVAIHAQEGGAALGPGLVTVELRMDRSRFSSERIVVREGTLLEIVVHNDDPIDHELVLGTEEVHARHSTGTEREHPPVPGEVSVAPGATGVTFYRFDEPGTVVFACHLPGHAAYGMTGEVVVVPA